MWKKLSRLMLVLGAMMTVVASSAEALQLTRMDSVMKISNHNGLAASCEGDLGGSTFLLNNEEVKLQTYLEMHKQKNAGGYIKLISRDGSRRLPVFSC